MNKQKLYSGHAVTKNYPLCTTIHLKELSMSSRQA